MIYVVATTQGPDAESVQIASSRNEQAAIDLSRELNAAAGVTGFYQVERYRDTEGFLLRSPTGMQFYCRTIERQDENGTPCRDAEWTKDPAKAHRFGSVSEADETQDAWSMCAGAFGIVPRSRPFGRAIYRRWLNGKKSLE